MAFSTLGNLRLKRGPYLLLAGAVALAVVVSWRVTYAPETAHERDVQGEDVQGRSVCMADALAGVRVRLRVISAQTGGALEHVEVFSARDSSDLNSTTWREKARARGSLIPRAKYPANDGSAYAVTDRTGRAILEVGVLVGADLGAGDTPGFRLRKYEGVGGLLLLASSGEERRVDPGTGIWSDVYVDGTAAELNMGDIEMVDR
jgi:hypothetical protein